MKLIEDELPDFYVRRGTPVDRHEVVQITTPSGAKKFLKVHRQTDELFTTVNPWAGSPGGWSNKQVEATLAKAGFKITKY